MVLWNHLIPDLFHGPELVYLQALGLMVLAKLLVGFGGPFGRGHWGGGHGPWGRGRGHGHHDHMRRHFLAHLSDEERKRIREELDRHSGEEPQG
jgi:hypothetical protein